MLCSRFIASKIFTGEIANSWETGYRLEMINEVSTELHA